MRFHIYFNWVIKEGEYRSYYKTNKESKEKNDPEILMNWEPEW